MTESRSISKMVASWLRAKPFSLSRIACARILVRQFGSVLWISLRRKRSSSVNGATNLVAVLIVGIVPENFCFATYMKSQYRQRALIERRHQVRSCVAASHYLLARF